LLPEDPALRWRRLELTGWAFALTFAYNHSWSGFLAWFSLARPLWIISSLPARQAFNAAYFFSFLFNLFGIYWLAMVTPPGMIAAVMIVSFYYTGILMAFWRLFRIRPLFGCVAIPFLWAGLEYFRTLSEFAFPWSDLGYTQVGYLYILQIVSIVSVHGLTILIVAINVLVWQIFRSELSYERRLTSFFTAAASVALLISYGWVETPRIPVEGNIELALHQGSVSLEDKWRRGNQQHSFDIYDSLTRANSDSAIALYVWPETSVPGYLSHDYYCRREVCRIARNSGRPHLVGSLAFGREGDKDRYYNACFQVSPEGVIEKEYHKVKLVPFSEHVPYQDHIPFLQKEVLKQYLTFIDQAGVQWWSDLYPGDSLLMFSIREGDFGVLICFEATFPEFVREYLLQGADFMVGITNDTWFGRSVGIYQHANMFITRAVENRCWMARVANSGLTFFVDPYGRVREQLDLYDVQTLRGKVAPLDGFSVFTRWGDIAGRVSLLITLSIVGILVLQWLFGRFFIRRH